MTPAQLISKIFWKRDSGLGVGFYAVIGGWSGHNYGLTIGESMSGMIRIAYFDLNDIYQASCNASDLNNFSYNIQYNDL